VVLQALRVAAAEAEANRFAAAEAQLQQARAAVEAAEGLAAARQVRPVASNALLLLFPRSQCTHELVAVVLHALLQAVRSIGYTATSHHSGLASLPGGCYCHL
jgi:hypothetical protein